MAIGYKQVVLTQKKLRVPGAPLWVPLNLPVQPVCSLCVRVCVCVCVCVRLCVRLCVRACVCVRARACETHYRINFYRHTAQVRVDNCLAVMCSSETVARISDVLIWPTFNLLSILKFALSEASSSQCLSHI